MNSWVWLNAVVETTIPFLTGNWSDVVQLCGNNIPKPRCLGFSSRCPLSKIMWHGGSANFRTFKLPKITSHCRTVQIYMARNWKQRKDCMEVCTGIWNYSDHVTYLWVMYCGNPFRATSSRVAPTHAVNAGEGVEGQLQPFLTSAVKRGEWSVSRPSCLTPAERAACTYWIEE